MRIKAKQAFNYPEGTGGDVRHVPEGWIGDIPGQYAEAQSKAGTVELLDAVTIEDKPRRGRPPKSDAEKADQ